MKPKTCIIISGPTAVGKTSLAIELAMYLNTDIISADSRQCFRELNIGVAKPSAAQLQQVKHYFINSHSIHDEVNAAVFEQYALDAVQHIFETHDTAVMVGGTGLYIKAFCEGMDEIPAIDPLVRDSIAAQYREGGIEWLQNEARVQDPDYYATGEIQNPQRLMRALEVKLSTGRSIRSFQQGKKAARNFAVIKIGLDLPRETLYQHINHRVDDMIQQGLVEEVKSLIPFQSLNALQTVGYTELFDYFSGKHLIDEAIDTIKKNTRHYAKRQLTWFRKDESMKWFSPLDYNQILFSLNNLV
jgi:tRNA dimethylallyltransferase